MSRSRSPFDRSLPALVLILVAALALVAPGAAVATPPADGLPDSAAERAAIGAPPEIPAALSALDWREVGPYRGGRSAAVAGIPSQRDVYYFGATGGGVWKTEDGGESWDSVSDGWFGGSIGAVAVSEWDPNVVYVGGGEKTVRGNVSHGDGVWKSTDAGRTWRHMGLGDTRHIPRIRIHPKDPDRVWVAALGHLYGPNQERGVFRSSDGGETWEKVLYVSEHAGAVDLVLDPTNPRILYASFWRVKRTPWSLESGGEGSSLWKSTDGGDTWTELTDNPGLPDGTWGISGISVSASDPDNLYAIVEADEGGVFRSRDGGATWSRTNSDRNLRQRAWYYTRIYADPNDAESVYVVNVRFHHSKDGGRTFDQIPTPHGDNHDLWIDPNDSARMIEANDGGANVTYDGGETWSTQANQPTAQMYRVSTDNSFPYRLLGGQQDNSAVRIRSRSFSGSVIGVRDWEPTAGGESGHIVAKPDDPDIVYGGSYGGYMVRVDHGTAQIRAVNPWPIDPMGGGAGDWKYRFQWNFPILFSPHDADVLYAAANVLFRSTDGGGSWEVISPDLTRADPDTLGSSGGPITQDNTGVEYYATIFAVAESPLEPGLIWAGSDDGLLHLTRDGGETWTDVTPPDLPEWTLINSIDAHPTDPGGLYVAATRYKLDDFEPYLWRTTDYGATWTRIDRGIPRTHFTRVVRADPEREGLLYAGTERGVYTSFDDGASWRPLQLDLPMVPITDLAVKEGDLVAATQGRGYWILDDLSVLRQVDPALLDDPAASTSASEGDDETGPPALGEHRLYAPRPAYRMEGGGGWWTVDNAGQNPPAGVWFFYHLPETPTADAEVTLEIVDPAGETIRTYTRKPEEGDDGARGGRWSENTALVEAERGLNRFVWDLSYPPARGFPGLILWNRNLDGPLAIPGLYRARLTVGEWSEETEFQVVADPRSSATRADYEAQRDFMLAVRDTLDETHAAIGRIREVRDQLDALTGRLDGDDSAAEVTEAAEALEEKLTAIEETLYQTKNESPQDPLNFPIRLNDKLAGLLGLAGFGDNRPTEQMQEARRTLTESIQEQLVALDQVWEEDLAAFNALAAEAGVAAVSVPTPTDDEADAGDDPENDTDAENDTDGDTDAETEPEADGQRQGALR